MTFQKHLPDYKLVGLQIRNIREAKRLSQEQLAHKTGLATGTIGKIERGENIPKTDTLLRIAYELDVPCKLFFETIDTDARLKETHLNQLMTYAQLLNDEQINALCTIARTINTLQ